MKKRPLDPRKTFIKMMNEKIVRDPGGCSDDRFDLIVVGGGIYGLMLGYEAARRGLRSLMLEKNDFWNATSLNHLRTVHGGLRYLQSLDINRFKESVAERKWFLRFFPQYVNPMPCIMPLYGKGMHRNSILRAGLLANDFLSFNRNRSVDRTKYLPAGKILSPKRTGEVFPRVDKDGLTGSAQWFDASMQEYQRFMSELLKLTAARGAAALNYMHVNELLKKDDRVAGVRALDRESGAQFEFKAPVVINAAGPWCREVAARFDKDHVPLFRKRLLLWNVLFNREALSNHALGLTTIKGGGHTYFFHPWKNRLLVGTGELLVEKSDGAAVPAKHLKRFVEDINAVVPGLDVSLADVQRVYSGVLPASENGRLANREVIYDHGVNDGPKGLFSISGVKFTTSRLVADKTLKKVFPHAKKMFHEKILEGMNTAGLSFDYDWEPSNGSDLNMLAEIVQNESVLHLSDLILRRTSLGDHPERALKILPKIKTIFNWPDQKWLEQVRALEMDLVV